MSSTAMVRLSAQFRYYLKSGLRASTMFRHQLHRSGRVLYSSQPLAEPSPNSESKTYPAKLQNIVSEISKLTLLEVAELNELLKKSLNIPDTPMMAMGAMHAPAAEAEEAEPVKTQTSFTIRLEKFEESKKVPVIKEIKNLIEGMNLVQAKKFVESAPQVIKADVGKDEAEKIKAALEAVGATCEIV